MYFDSFFLFFKQKTAYEMRISDWSSDVCSSDLEAEAEIGPSQQGGDRVEIEQALQQVGIIGDRIDHRHLQGAEGCLADAVEIDFDAVADQVAVDALGAGINRLGEGLRCRPAIGDIELDAEIAARAAGIGAGGQHDTTRS